MGVDFTKSNLSLGAHSFGGKSLHHVSRGKGKRKKNAGPTKNPYQEVLATISSHLAEFDTDQLFPVYGFGDTVTGSGHVFSFQPYDQPCEGLGSVLARYEAIAKCVCMSGPTSFAPLVKQAIKIVRETNEHNILLIVADGAVSQSETAATEAAICEASWYPLSIVVVGVGDGPWDIMEKYDDRLKNRRFDNFQFVEYSTLSLQYPGESRSLAFATHALMEVPAQYNAAKILGYFNELRDLPPFREPPPPLGPPDKPNAGDPHSGLVPDWTAVYDCNQKSYFYMNVKTNERVWGRPVHDACMVGERASITDDDNLLT